MSPNSPKQFPVWNTNNKASKTETNITVQNKPTVNSGANSAQSSVTPSSQESSSGVDDSKPGGVGTLISKFNVKQNSDAPQLVKKGM